MGGMPGPGMGGMGGGNQNYRSASFECVWSSITNKLQSHGSCWCRPFISTVEDHAL